MVHTYQVRLLPSQSDSWDQDHVEVEQCAVQLAAEYDSLHLPLAYSYKCLLLSCGPEGLAEDWTRWCSPAAGWVVCIHSQVHGHDQWEQPCLMVLQVSTEVIIW